MNLPIDQPDSRGESTPSSSFADASGGPPVSGPETVVNPEGRPDYAPPVQASVSPPVTDPSAWHHLFPATNENGSVDASPIGVELDHFVIEERIRSGGMGAVFRARDIRMGRSVALKVMPPRQTLNPAAVRRFQNEAQAAAQLDHDNIARAYYVGEDKGLHFIAFEFVTGINIAEMISKQGRLPVDDALNYTLQVASALVHTSERGVVHRDIKPSNIIITPKGRAKLVDMGLARNENREASADLTVAGTTLGTFDYISPEQAKDPRAVDVRSDIYSLGCTLYHMLTGQAPYPGGTMLQKLLDHQGKDAPDPAAKNPYVSDDLAAVVRKMMASDPKRRYQTADELLRDLMLVAGAMGLRSLNPEGLVWMSSRPLSAPFWERHLPWMSTFAALIILVTVASFLPGRVADGPGIAPNADPTTDQADNGTDAKAAGTESPDMPNDLQPNTDVVKSQTIDTGATPPDSNGTEEEKPRPIGEKGPAVVAENSTTHPKFPPATSTDQDLLNSFVIGPAENEQFRLGPEGSGSYVTALLPPLQLETAEPVAQPIPDEIGNKSQQPRVRKMPAEPIADRPFIVLGIDGAENREYRSLEAACTDAVDGGKIELRYNGIRRERTPIRIEGKRITIRAGIGFRPTLELAPSQSPLAGYRNHFINVVGGALEMANVNLLLSITEGFPSDRWAIFSLEQPESVQMEGVTVTVENRDRHRQIAVFDLSSRTNFSDMPLPDNGTLKPLQVMISRCVFRGGCDFLTVHQQTGSQFTIENTLLAFWPNGTVVRVLGGMYEQDDDEYVDFTLKHCTVLLSNSLVVMSSDTVPHKLIPVQVTATNNIISSFEICPLVEMSGRAPVNDFRDLIQWTGKYNFYDDFTDFWQIESNSTDEGLDTLDFEDWQKWRTVNEVDAYNERIYWEERQQKSWRDMSAATLTPNNVRLHPTITNRASSGTATGSQAGARLDELPRLGRSEAE
ncbi:Serine/threonine-protein kinase PrkC [Symmachiella macrocystis]|uniref:Serine/threonine-protein kinase PrkC n=1 Tax=Symmachiella macrocystis TaxID=2527985 RepID=A0A5C6B6H8_9PLAN|nr:serine/threonine-protein kinase [Symmachiella macrocystis]TWU07377.1 Serine/threonine-protein kinase PrkC [Symmachiella macrocystis]